MRVLSHNFTGATRFTMRKVVTVLLQALSCPSDLISSPSDQLPCLCRRERHITDYHSFFFCITHNYTTSENVTLISIFPEFLKIRKINVAATTWRKDIRNFEMYISDSPTGQKPLKDLSLKDGYDFFNHCRKIKPDLKRKYWNSISVTLKAIFQYCIDSGVIHANPFANMRLNQNLFEPPTKQQPGINVFSDRERALVCSEALEDANRTKSAIPLGIIVLFNLGIRIGELCAIKWRDFYDRNGKLYIHIQREMVDDVDDNGKSKGCIILEHCKTPTSDRELLLNQKCREMFKMVHDINKAAGLPTSDDDFVFLRTRKGKITFCTARSFAPRLQKYCRKVGMETSKSPHDVRRTALTNMYRAGMALTAVQKYAGHSTLKQTLDYLKLQDDEDINAPLEKISECATNIIEFKRQTSVEQSGTALFL